MALSRKWQVDTLAHHVMASLNLDDPVAWVQRIESLNLIQQQIANQFYAVMADAYMTPTVVQVDTVGRYAAPSDVSSATWVAATRTLACVMTPAFASTDIGKTVVFRSGIYTYIGFIETFVSVSAVTLNGFALPLANITAGNVNEILVVGTTPTTDVVDLSTIPIYRTGEQIKISLESTRTIAMDPMSVDQLRVFRPLADKNLTRIAWCIQGEQILLRRGISLPDYGTLLLRYPKIPNSLVQGADGIDLLDGVPIGMMFNMYRRKLLKVTTPSDQNEMISLANDLNRNFAGNMTLTEIKKKVEALS